MADEFQFLLPEAGLKTEIKTNSASWAWAVGRWGDHRGMCSLDFACIWSNPFFFRWLWRFLIDSGELFVTHPAKHQGTLLLNGIGETNASHVDQLLYPKPSSRSDVWIRGELPWNILLIAQNVTRIKTFPCKFEYNPFFWVAGCCCANFDF